MQKKILYFYYINGIDLQPLYKENVGKKTLAKNRLALVELKTLITILVSRKGITQNKNKMIDKETLYNGSIMSFTQKKPTIRIKRAVLTDYSQLIY